jgi:hypothetical protein
MAGLAAGGVSIQTINILKETANRALSLPDAAAQALGLAPTKKLRLRVVILRDENSNPLAEEELVEDSIRAAEEIFMRQAHTRIVPAGGRYVERLASPAPVDALDIHCDMEAWKEGLREAGDYFETYLTQNAAGALTGYAAPVTAFIVRDVDGKAGCSLGPLADYVTVALCGLATTGLDEDGRPLPRILAHEVGHACGLWHVRDPMNLMDPRGPGVSLRPWQRLILRNSRHVTYL